MIAGQIPSDNEVIFPVKDSFQKAILSRATIDEHSPKA
jgi:hypothetical protein